MRHGLLAILVVLFAVPAIAQEYNVAARRRSTFTPVSFLSTIDYCWFYYTSGDAAGALDNACSVGAAGDLSAVNDPANYTGSPPAGAAAGKDAVTGDASVGFEMSDPGSEPQSWSVGCWLTDASSNDTIFYQATDAAGINMRLKNSTQELYDGSINGGNVTGADGSALTGFRHVAMTYDHTNAGADSIKIYINGTQAATGNGVDPDAATQNYFIASNDAGGAVWNGPLYECFFDFNNLTASQICQIATYGLNGDATHTTGCTP